VPTFTASSMGTAMSCPRLYKYKYLELYREKGMSPAMKVGILVHKGLEGFWQGRTVNTSIQMMQDEAYSDNGMGQVEWWMSDEGRVAYRKAKAYLIGYYKKYPMPHEIVLGRMEKVFDVYIEKEFAFDIEIAPKVNATFKGKFDVLVHHYQDNRIEVIEHKTTGTTIDTTTGVYFERLPMDVQCTIYREAAFQFMIDKHNSGEACLGGVGFPKVDVIYDVINTTKAAPKQKKKIAKRKTETDEEYAQRKEDNQESIEEFYLRMVTYYEEHPEKYVRHEVPTTFEQHKSRLQELTDYAKTLDTTVGFTEIRNSSSCFNYGGCSFMDICLGRDTLEGSQKFEKIEARHPELDGKGNIKCQF